MVLKRRQWFFHDLTMWESCHHWCHLACAGSGQPWGLSDSIVPGFIAWTTSPANKAQREAFWTPKMVTEMKRENHVFFTFSALPNLSLHTGAHSPLLPIIHHYPLAQRKHNFLLGLNARQLSNYQKQFQFQRMYTLVLPYKSFHVKTQTSLVRMYPLYSKIKVTWRGTNY